MSPDDRALAIGRALLALVEALGIPATAAPDPLVLVDQLPALYPGLSKAMAAAAARAGQLPAIKVGRKVAVRRSDVDRWLASRRIEPRRRRTPAAIDPATEYENMTRGGK